MFQAHLTKTFWNILPPTFCSKNSIFQTTCVLGAPAPEHGFQAQGWPSLSLSRQSSGEAPAVAGRTAPGTGQLRAAAPHITEQDAPQR